MPLRDEILDWLKNEVRLSVVNELWIFGSFVNPKLCYADVDIFIGYRDGSVNVIVPFRRALERRFFAKFEIPLHSLFLNETECLAESQFLAGALASAIRVL